jgi:hypothetical protein
MSNIDESIGSSPVRNDEVNTPEKTGRGPNKGSAPRTPVALQFNPSTGVCTGPGDKPAKYRSFVGQLSRERVSILIKDWRKDVSDAEKAKYWAEIEVI